VLLQHCQEALVVFALGMADLAKTLSLIGCRLRLKCSCSHCVPHKNRSRSSQGAGIDLADLIDTDLGCSSAPAAAPPPQKISVVPQLPMPAGGFCRRSAAVQWALAKEMSRQAAEEDFDCANEDWPALFAVDDLDDDDLGFDFELVGAEDDDDEFVLELLEDDEGNLDGEWAHLERSCKLSSDPGPLAAPSLDFKTAIYRHSVAAAPTMLLNIREVEAAAKVKDGADRDDAPRIEESTQEWPLLAGGPQALPSCSPTSVFDFAGQWVSVVEKSKEVRMPSDDKKSRNFREACKRAVAQIRRAEKKAAQGKAKTAAPAEDFPPLPV
jgi:hypothetical protein